MSFTIHEFAHAYSAYKFGDRTAYDAGRVTLDPRSHLDIFGTILILIAGFGWAKPVPVNRGRFKYPRLMGIIVSAVGPLSNLLLAVIGMLLVYTLNQTGVLGSVSHGTLQAISHFTYYLISTNLLLFLFNFIPLPPLDGYRIIEDLVPLSVRHKMDQNTQWGMFIFLLLVFIPPLRQQTLDPYLGLWPDIWAFIAINLQSIFDPVEWSVFWRDF
nr:site-2 protease family protein [Paenibacillus phyllosphaerae]